MKPTVILLGTKPASILVLKKMLKAQWDVKAVVMPSNYDQGWMPQPTLADFALENSIPIYSCQEDVDLNKVDYVISYMYRYLVKSNMINKAQRAAVNFHPAPLPKFGGFAFYNVAILEGSKYYGCSCHHMDSSFDTGNLVKVRTFEINASEETAVSLERKTQNEMLNLFDDFMGLAELDLPLPSLPQDPAVHRYMNKNEFSLLKVIKNNVSAEEAQRIARAFWYPPYECAHLFTEKGVKIQVVPNLVMEELGALTHQDDFIRLENHKV